MKEYFRSSVDSWSLACRVGNSSSISIIDNPWLPSEDNPYVQTLHKALKEKMVASFMITWGNRWDIDLITDIFESKDIDLILSISLQNNDDDI